MRLATAGPDTDPRKQWSHSILIVQPAPPNMSSAFWGKDPSCNQRRRSMSAHGANRERDSRVDFFRGVALLFIFVDHIPGNSLAWFTLHNFGFADAAEIFVALAGYAAFLAYTRTFDQYGARAGVVRVARRVRDLYVAHLILLCVCVGGLALAARAFQNPVYFEHVNLTPFNHDAAGAIWRTLILVYQPGYLNILPLYMVLLAWFPILLWLMRRHLCVALFGSFAVWMAANVLQYNLPSYPTDYGWVFNPFAWQFLFSLGVISAALMSKRDSPWHSSWLVWLAVAYVLFAFVVAGPWTRLPGLGEMRLLPTDFRTSISKQNLSLWRVAHIAALAYLAATLIPRRAPWLTRPWARWMVNCGSHSLQVFCLGTILSMAAFVAMVEVGPGLGTHIVVNVTGFAILGLAAWKLAQLKRAKARARSAHDAAAWSGELPLSR
jgi:hypothetical protein